MRDQQPLLVQVGNGAGGGHRGSLLPSPGPAVWAPRADSRPEALLASISCVSSVAILPALPYLTSVPKQQAASSKRIALFSGS